MNNYKQSITLFGFVIPVLLLVVFSIICVVVSGNIKAKAIERETAFAQHNRLQTQVTQLQAGMREKRDAIEQWQKVVSSDIRPDLQLNLKNILEKYSSRQIAQTGFFRPATLGRLAMGAQQQSSSVTLKFRGTYLPMEKALIELESRLPQMQVNSFSIKRERSADELLFDLSYTIWEKKDSQ